MPQSRWSAVAIILLIAATPFIGPLSRGEVFRYRDHLHYFEPLRLFTATQLARGELPLWNPYNASGEPWLANPQTCVFYPPAWLFLVLPFAAAYMLFLFVHFAILGCGAYLLMRRLASPAGALVGAVALMCSGPTLSFVDVSDNFTSFAWLPLVVWSALSIADRRVPRSVASLVLALSFLAGQPFFALLGAMLFVATRAMRGKGWPGDVIVAGVGAFALSAVQLLPFAAMIAGTDRAGAFAERRILRESIPPADWLRLATFPRMNASGVDTTLGQSFIPMPYLGLLVVALAVIAIVRWRERPRLVLASSALIALALIAAAGGNLPTGRLFVVLPVTITRYPSRLVALVALAVAALAAAGWDRVRPRRAWADLLVVAVIAADLLLRGAPLLATVPFRGGVVPWPAAVGQQAKVFRLPTLGPTTTDREAWLFGYINLFGPRFDSGSGAPLVQTRYGRIFETALRELRVDLLRFLSAGDILSDRALPLPAVSHVRHVTAYHDAGALPFASVWTSAIPQPPDAAVESLLVRPLTARLPVWPAPQSRMDGAPRVMPGTLRSMDTRRAQVHVETNAPAIVMLTQQDAPGWRVYVDGAEQQKLLAGGIFRAVEVAPGSHEVEWRYRPAGLLPGAVLTLGGLAWLVAGLWRAFRPPHDGTSVAA